MPSSLKKKLTELKKSKIYKSLGKEKVKRSTLLVVFTVLLFVIVVESISPEKIVVEVGDIAQEDIRATKDIVDEELTQKLKQEAYTRVENRYRIDSSIQGKIKEDIKSFFNIIKDFKNNESTEDDTLSLEKMLSEQNYIKITKEDYEIILRQSSQSILLLENDIYETIDQVMGIGIKEEDLDYEKTNINKIFESYSNLSDELKVIGSRIINNSIKPNKFLDAEATKEKREEAVEQVEPVIIREGQIIVERRQIINQKSYDLIKKSGLLKNDAGIDYGILVGAIVLVALVETITIGYIYLFDKKAFYNNKLLSALAIMIISVVIISRITSAISGYLMPISIATILITILINPKLAIVVNIMLSIIIGTTTSSELSVIIMCLLGGIGGAFAAINTQQRYNIIITGFIISAINVFTILVFGLIYNFETNELLLRLVYGFSNGILSSIIAIGSLPVWESLFGILTPLKLLELSNPNQPLLKRLLLEAPGTYHHSVLVGNLGEAAAEVVGANPLLARVGAYYHDVGKLKRPYFFKENQISGENPHDKINPSLSALIITNHTKDGEELANQYKIPYEISNIIKEHHGTTLVAFFYHKAMNDDKSGQVEEDRFRYEGPKPQSKEAAIIMLSDSVEAAVRSINQPNKGKIEAMVRKVVKGKLNDGQLDECALTLKDVNNIINAFVNVLMGIYHQRIEYPDLDIRELKGGN